MRSFMYIQFGSGLRAVEGWINYDSSPTLRIQKLPFANILFKKVLSCRFDDQIIYGDIVKGLGVPNESADGIFCSHVLEHLSLDDFHTALTNIFYILKKGGRFRVIVPNLKYYINNYLDSVPSPQTIEMTSAYKFNIETCYGRNYSRSTLSKRLVEAFGNSYHLWMWDLESLKLALELAGFHDVTEFSKGSCNDVSFLAPERDYQFMNNAISLECFRRN